MTIDLGELSDEMQMIGLEYDQSLSHPLRQCHCWHDNLGERNVKTTAVSASTSATKSHRHSAQQASSILNADSIGSDDLSSQVAQLQRSLNAAHEAVTYLQDRLSPILRPEVIEPESISDPHPHTYSPVEQQVYYSGLEVDRLIKRIHIIAGCAAT